MFWFTIKKTFFDFWDNMLTMVLLNVGFLILVALLLAGLQLAGGQPIVFLLIAAGGVVMLTIALGVTAELVNALADYQPINFKQALPALRRTWKPACVFAALLLSQMVMARLVIPWYLKLGSLIGIGIAGALFWTNLAWLLASQYFFPLRSRLGTSIKKIPGKCLLLLFDNTLFTLALAFGALVLLFLSSVTAFLLPGIATILLWYQVALKLRLYKYDYLATHPTAKRRAIPWPELLAEDRERVGERSLRQMIFPWK